MSSNLILKVSDLGKSYYIENRPWARLKEILFSAKPPAENQFWALRNVDLEVERGTSIGIIGRNGSGKSTLLQLIAGTLHPTTGNVMVDGRISALLELGAGFNPYFTGLDNIKLNSVIMGVSSKKMADRIEQIVEFSELGEFINRPVKTYSSGMYARLAFSVAIHVQPDLLIVDEILSVGDASFQQKCLKKFTAIRDKGCTVLFVSHDSYQIKSICQKALYLVHGMPKKFGPADEVVDQYNYDIERESNAKANGGEVEEKNFNYESDLFRIKDVRLLDARGEEVDTVTTGQDIELHFIYQKLNRDADCRVTFVANLYRHDQLYIMGVTTLMDGHSPQPARREGEVVLKLPNLRLLAGRYCWRVAVNDESCMAILAQANPVCHFKVKDDFQAVALVDLERQWVL